MKIFLVEKNGFEYNDENFVDNKTYTPQISFTSRDLAKDAKDKLEIDQCKEYGKFSSVSDFVIIGFTIEKFIHKHFSKSQAEQLIKKLDGMNLEFSDIPDKLLPEFLEKAGISFARIIEIDLKEGV